ncbi:MAG: GDP-L-fucose synthase [Xanthobacteraceae bacterium]
MPKRARQTYDLTRKRVWVAGHRGLVGGAVVRRLARENCDVLTVGRETVDLRRQADVERWMQDARLDAVFLAAATVGGILANDTHPVDFLYDNLAIETNIVEAARQTGVGRLLFLGSSCIYPRLAPQPMQEDALLTGPLEPTNQWYAIAKITGIMLCRAYRRQYGLDFISAMPTNVYGPGDNFDLQSSHVIPALLAKAHAAKVNGESDLVVWGTGKPLREFLHVDDLADALVFLMQNYSGEEHVNIGVGSDVTIKSLAEMVVRVVGFKGGLRFDTSMPDGMPRKLLDSSRLFGMGWRPRIGLEDGLRQTYDWYLSNLTGGTRAAQHAR